MNKLKGFVEEKKNEIMIGAAIFASIILFVVLIMLVSGGKSGDDGNISNSDIYEIPDVTAKPEEETETETETKELPPMTDEGMAEEQTTEGESAEGQTTAPPVKVEDLPYKIRINRAANCITVYGKDDKGGYTKPVKAIVCSTGREVGFTPLGNFKTIVSYKWLLMVDGTYGQYAYRFKGPILFHSVPYFSKNKNDLEWDQFNKLGEPASLGCVRVCVRDAIWLISNCPIGTAVEVYDDAANPGPLGKPEMIKIPENSPYRGWDPTDPDPANPWLNCKPQIVASKNKVTVKEGTNTEAILKQLGVKATDTCGNDITSDVTLTGVGASPKTYTAKLTVTDLLGKKAELSVTVVVEKEKSQTTTPTQSKPEKDTTAKPTVKPTQKPTQKPTEEPTTEKKPTVEETTPVQKPTVEETTTPEVTTPEATTPEETTPEETTPESTSDNKSEENTSGEDDPVSPENDDDGEVAGDDLA